MKKILGGSLCCMLLIGSILSSATFIIDNKSIKEIENFNEQAGFAAINIDEKTIKITVNPRGFEFESITSKEGMFASVRLPGYVYTLVRGEAKLPVIRKMIEIPYKSTPELVVTSISWDYTSLSELGLPNIIIPAQQSVEKIPEPEDDFVIDEKYYSTDTFFT